MKKMSKNVLLVFLGIVISFVTNVAAEAVISSGAVSYSNTTVSAALDELFSAVDINNKIGTTDISTIGDGTITGAISNHQDQIAAHSSTLSKVITKKAITFQSWWSMALVRGDASYITLYFNGIHIGEPGEQLLIDGTVTVRIGTTDYTLNSPKAIQYSNGLVITSATGGYGMSGAAIIISTFTVSQK